MNSHRLCTPDDELVHNSALSSAEITLPCADPGSRAVQCVGLRPLACWNVGFKSCRGQGCLSVVTIFCYQAEVSLIQRSPTEYGVCVCVCVCVCVSLSVVRWNKNPEWVEEVRLRRKKDRSTALSIECVMPRVGPG